MSYTWSTSKVGTSIYLGLRLGSVPEAVRDRQQFVNLLQALDFCVRHFIHHPVASSSVIQQFLLRGLKFTHFCHLQEYSITTEWFCVYILCIYTRVYTDVYTDRH